MPDHELQAWHRPRIGALLEAGADLLAIETIPCQREAELVVKLLECEFPSSQAWTLCKPDGLGTGLIVRFSESSGLPRTCLRNSTSGQELPCLLTRPRNNASWLDSTVAGYGMRPICGFDVDQ
ncbi:hypothetical protein DPMN_132285 [Dreissena polymorpha]|uniref:Hcy-binding domain-containing protein n=1 Tax=Dreissena polymorpha TaxID=45954 RepID=A0A9D4FT28_DREPO|nr:hypothetical protein DPMN_132285 [Dreissena polymorpha]